MTKTAHGSIRARPRPNRLNRIAKRRLEHLRHIHPLTHEQQLALIAEARAARHQVEQESVVAEHQ